YVVTKLDRGIFTEAKKVFNTENIFVIKVDKNWRLFYTVQKNKDQQEFILLLDIVKKTNYNSNYSLDIIKELHDYRDKF
ncbi:hypothetical protein V7054_14795, partial [Priestia megaterium]|uniref:hypothetical protein n=1 Tax=Priestia megaterium TaxID=1404 RepID=UPI002FFDFE90